MLIFLSTPLIEILFNKFPQNFRKDRSYLDMREFSNLIVIKPYTMSVFPATVLIAIYIILTLLTVVKISKMDQGPLRVI